MLLEIRLPLEMQFSMICLFFSNHGNIEIVHPGRTEGKCSVRKSVAAVLRRSWLALLAPQLRLCSSFSLFAKVMSVSIIHTVVRLLNYFMVCGNCVAKLS